MLAAGLGSRLDPFTRVTPKPLLPVLGVPIAQFAIDALAQADVHHVCVNLHHLAERCRVGFLGLEHPASLTFVFSPEMRSILGSAGGLRQAFAQLPRPDRPAYWINGDVVADVDLKRLALAHARARAQSRAVLTLAIRPADASLVGSYREVMLTRAEGQERVAGLGGVRAGAPVFTGVAIVEPEFVADLALGVAADATPDRLDRFAREGRVAAYVLKPGALWCDIGTPEHWLATHLALMDALELGAVPLSIRHRIERTSERVGSGVWSALATRTNASQVSAELGRAYVGQAIVPGRSWGGTLVHYDAGAWGRATIAPQTTAAISYGGFVWQASGNRPSSNRA